MQGRFHIAVFLRVYLAANVCRAQDLALRAYLNHQSIKFSYSNRAYIKYGGNFQNVSLAWQYSWLGGPNSRSLWF